MAVPAAPTTADPATSGNEIEAPSAPSGFDEFEQWQSSSRPNERDGSRIKSKGGGRGATSAQGKRGIGPAEPMAKEFDERIRDEVMQESLPTVLSSEETATTATSRTADAKNNSQPWSNVIMMGAPSEINAGSNKNLAPQMPAPKTRKPKTRKATASMHSTTSSLGWGGDDPLTRSERSSGTSVARSFARWRSASRPKRRGGDPNNRLALVDDEEGHAEFFLTLLYESLEDSKLFVFGSVGVLVAWSLLCAFFSEWMRELALADPGGRAERWMEDIKSCKSAISILGTLFVFTLVFRFNTCYDRWWESRVFWGDIISRCLDLNMMNRRWIADQDLGDRLSRFIIAYAYACKALLRGTSLAAEEEDGKALVQRGILTQEELDDMHNNPCWQPHYCLEMCRAILVEAHKVPGGKGLYMDENNKLHGQMFRCFDGIIKLMCDVIGDSVRTRASGLPASYDAITMTSFFMFFILAAFVWSIGIGWMTPVIIGCASFIIMLLIVMGSKLVDPFGYDKVDIPMEAFCATIEAQVHAIDERARSGIIEKFARTSRPRAVLARRATVHIPKLN